MADPGERIFAAAQAMVGVPFRAQGHDPETGLDCVGLVWAAHAAAGVRLVRPSGYPLRGWRRARIEAALVEAGLREARDAGRPGDVVLMALPAGQYHLALTGAASIVHAHAGLRRVVEAPRDVALATMARWRWQQ